ncbi:helix-turn-helix transcriptional regulator [Leucobacter sp. HY1908]
MPHKFELKNEAFAECSQVFDNHAADTKRVSHDILQFVQSLPAQARHWSLGEQHDANTFRVEHLTGPWASDYAWREHFTRQESAGAQHLEIFGLFPHFGRFGFEGSDLKDTAAFIHAVSRYRLARGLFSAPLPAAALPFLAPFAEAGAEFRLHQRMPTWMWVDSGTTVAVPTTPGVRDRGDVTVIHSPVLAHAARELFRRLWLTSFSIDDPTRAPWYALLSLLNEGHTIASAAAKLGVSARTARRKLDSAMEHYNTDSFFTLATAWGADTAAHPPILPHHDVGVTPPSRARETP